MTEIIIKAIAFIIQTALICGYGVLSYRCGVKDGVRRAVIQVLKDEDIVKESKEV